MRKSKILFIAIALSLLLFVLLGRVFHGVSYSLADRLYQPDYLKPSPKDSAYMLLLQDLDTRPIAMSISDDIRPFYITADSIRTILRADLSADLLADLIINKGFAQDMRQQLLHFNTDSLIVCQPPCLDSVFVQNERAWLAAFSTATKEEMTTFVEMHIQRVEENELRVLEGLVIGHLEDVR